MEDVFGISQISDRVWNLVVLWLSHFKLSWDFESHLRFQAEVLKQIEEEPLVPARPLKAKLYHGEFEQKLMAQAKPSLFTLCTLSFWCWPKSMTKPWNQNLPTKPMLGSLPHSCTIHRMRDFSARSTGLTGLAMSLFQPDVLDCGRAEATCSSVANAAASQYLSYQSHIQIGLDSCQILPRWLHSWFHYPLHRHRRQRKDCSGFERPIATDQ